MPTMHDLPVNHFDGHSNLTQAQKNGSGPTLAEQMAYIYDDMSALESEVAARQDPKDSVRVATAAALPACTAAGSGVGKTLTMNAAGVLTVDVVATALGDDILVKDQVAADDNGIYTVTTEGTVAVAAVLTRRTDSDTSAKVTSGMNCHVSEGGTLADTHWMLTTNDPIVLDTTALVFEIMHPPVHAASHILGGTDAVDGDQLDIDMTPTHYTPDAGVPEAGNVDHLAAHLGGIDNEIGTIYLRTGHPEIAALRVAGGTLSANGSENFTLLGTAFLQGQTFATVTIGASLAITAEEPGVAGNSINVEVVDTGGAGPATVAYAAGTLTIDQVGSASDEDTLAALINVTGQTWTGVLRATSGAGGAVAVTASTPLAGGAGAGVTVYAGAGTCGWTGQVGGITDSDATASVQDTILYVNPPDMTALVPALAAADVASVWVDSNEMTTRAVSVVLA